MAEGRRRGQGIPRLHCKAGHKLTDPDPRSSSAKICRLCSRRRSAEQLAAIQQAARLLGMLQVDYTATYGWSKVRALEIVSEIEDGARTAPSTASTELHNGSDINSSSTAALS